MSTRKFDLQGLFVNKVSGSATLVFREHSARINEETASSASIHNATLMEFVGDFTQQTLWNASYQSKICAIPQKTFRANVQNAEHPNKKMCA